MHGRILAGMTAGALSISSIACGDSIFINEFHYDDPGTRHSNDFVEVAVPTGTDLTGLMVAIYKGSGVLWYTTLVEFYFVGGTAGDFSLYWANCQMEDGSGAVALIRDGSVLEFLSYEGILTASDGPAMGAVSTDIGVAEAGSVLGTSVGRTGAGNSASDFTWALFANDTPGQLNTGQSFTSLDVAVAPLPLAGLAALGLVAGFAMTRKTGRNQIF